MHSIVALLYGCGLRVCELTGLDMAAGADAAGWIDVDNASAHLLGKGRKCRSVPMGGPALAAWLALRCQLARRGEPALFVSSRGTRLSDSRCTPSQSTRIWLRSTTQPARWARRR